MHWTNHGAYNGLGGGTGSIAVREDGSIAAFTPSRGVTLHVSSSLASCKGGDCLNNWTSVGSVLGQPPQGSSAGFRDPARPWRAADGHWYIVVGGGIQGKEAQGHLYRAEDASLTKFNYVTAILTRNRTVGFGKNNGFFDMMECPDFFPIGPKSKADGSQKHVFISSAYSAKSVLYPNDGFHNAVTWWIGKWLPGGILDVESSGIVDWGAVIYYSAKSLSDGRPGNDAETRLLGGWVMDSNGMSEPKYCKNGDASPNGLAWVICPEAFHRHVYLCTNTTTGKAAMCQAPASQLVALRDDKPPVATKINTCGKSAGNAVAQALPIVGLQLEIQLNVTLCDRGTNAAGGAPSGEVGVGLFESNDGSGAESTRIGYDFTTRTLFVDRSKSSTLPAAVPGGGVLNSTGKQGYGQRSREVAPLPEVTASSSISSGSTDGGSDVPNNANGSLQLTIYVDHSILTIFANDAAVITTRIYTAGGNNSASVSFFASNLAGVGVQGTLTAWPLSLETQKSDVK